ncbi:hypothetical protein PMIN06_005583 [Paraphaeosphaeria minitans]
MGVIYMTMKLQSQWASNPISKEKVRGLAATLTVDECTRSSYIEISALYRKSPPKTPSGKKTINRKRKKTATSPAAFECESCDTQIASIAMQNDIAVELASSKARRPTRSIATNMRTVAKIFQVSTHAASIDA